MQSIYDICQLHPTSDSIRLVAIEQQPYQGRISCSLKTVKFAERPRYEALSYRWGDETRKRSIFLEKQLVEVTENLYDALFYLQQNPRSQPIWIDAISINQSDSAEKTRQLRIMPHIYTRASAVLVFLGLQYTTAKPAGLIADDPYWSRLWILQEVANAKDLYLLLNRPTPWNEFIESLSESDRDIIGKVDQLRREKYSGTRSLRQLVERFADALCKDPKDKIYGLIGLSSDGQGFPIDYSKSESDIWGDTMGFLGRQGLFAKDSKDCFAVGDTIRKSLGSPLSIKGVIDFHNHPDNHSLHDWRVTGKEANALRFTADVLGTIVSLGPSPSELAESLDLTDQWNREIQRLFPSEREAAGEESDLVMDTVLENTDTRLSQWTGFEHDRVDFYGPGIYRWMLQEPGREMGHEYKSAWKHTPTSLHEPRFVLIKEAFDKDDTWVRIAMVPPSALLGDHVCRIPNSPLKPFLLRPELCSTRQNLYSGGTMTMYVAGSAVLLGDKPGGTVHNRIEMSMSGRTLFALMYED